MNALHETCFVRKFFQSDRTDSRHDAHIGDDVGTVRDDDSHLSHRASRRTHQIRNHVHHATRHAAVKQAVHEVPHLDGVHPVIARAGVLLGRTADKSAALNAGDVVDIAAGVERIRVPDRVERNERPVLRQQVVQPLAFRFGPGAPVNDVRLRQLTRLLNPGNQLAVEVGRLKHAGRKRSERLHNDSILCSHKRRASCSRQICTQQGILPGMR